ncbi:sphingoid long-chain bases kinase 1-like isoform X3 [Populus alba x Populus x berolinensis]|nr:sphingoid long-chain bases kinase 1-like isoform X3 [Populus alba x Populus x berolinensis]
MRPKQRGPNPNARFKLEVVKTTSAGHAKNLASTVDISTCPDGIICVGGDGIINEVLNGLLSRDNQKEGISIPIGIIPAGSDNSLVWTVLGVRDPVSAAISIVKGGLTATDVFAVEWIQSGVIHFGMTVSYYGFVSDVLELSEKYQKRFGPLRYFVAGFLKFFCLPKYSYEVEYLPASKEDREGKQSAEGDIVDMPDLYTDVMRRSNTDGIPRASSLSSIDSIMTPSRMSGGDMDTTCSSTHASTEPSDYVRGLDPKAKRLSSGRTNVMPEPEVIHPQLPLSTTPNWPRTRSKSRADKGWTGLTTTHDPSRCSWGNASMNDREDISSTISDPGPIWDAEPKWDTEPNWDVENPIDLPGPSDDIEAGMKKEVIPRLEDKWEFKKGQFLGILNCSEFSGGSTKAEHDDNTMDMLLVHGSGRWRLLRFFLRLQMGQHLSLPYVEYIKVKSVKIKAGKHTPTGCGIDGELIQLNGQSFGPIRRRKKKVSGRDEYELGVIVGCHRCSQFGVPATDTNKFKFNALISPNPRLNCRYSIITPTATSIATSSSSRRRRKTAVSCSVALGSNNSATMVTDDEEEEEAKKKIGARVRVKAPVKVYHVPRVAEEVDLCGLEGEVKQYVSQWKGRRVSANLPYKTHCLVGYDIASLSIADHAAFFEACTVQLPVCSSPK